MRDVRQKLRGLNGRLESGQIDVDQWADEYYKVVYEGHLKAAALGQSRAGLKQLDHNELLRIARQKADEETEFIHGFASTLKAKDPRYHDPDTGSLKRGSLEPRTDLYVGKMRGTANEQFVEASPADALWTWHLGANEDHCPDCPRYAAAIHHVPIEEVFAFPGQGDSACLGHCDCHLERDDGVRGFKNNDEHVARADQSGPKVQPPLPGLRNAGLVPAPPPAQGARAAGDWSDNPSICADTVARGEARKLVDRLMAEVDDFLRAPDTPPTLRVGTGRIKNRSLGVYDPRDDSIRVDVNGAAKNEPHLTLAHEVGHFMDIGMMLIAGQVPASSAAASFGVGPLIDWAKAVHQSQMFSNLEELVRQKPGWYWAVYEYYLTPEEIWARSIAQYVATRSKSRIIHEEWEVMGQHAIDGVLVHWDPADFKPIYDAIEKCLRAAGFHVR